MTTDVLRFQAVDQAEAGDRRFRHALFLLIFLLTWVTASPFPDLGDPARLKAVGSGDFLGQILMLLATGASALWLWVRDKRLALISLSWPLVLTFAWFTLSVTTAIYPELAGRRLLLAALIIFQAATLLLLPRNREDFARLLAIGALIVLVLCYGGVLLAPHLSIHQPTDLAEPELAGDWRGVFTHKNGAGAGMVVLIFIGLFVYRILNRGVGVLIVASAAVFLVFTRAASPLLLLPLAVLAAALLPRLASTGAKTALMLFVLTIINGATVGSVIFPPILRLLEQVMPDPTFTGRDVIWRFALDHVAQRPFTGFGFQAFWGTEKLLSAWTVFESWGYRASDAHNGYLNLAVMTGVIGLGLALIWILVQPMRDLTRSLAQGVDPVLTTLFLRLWVFGLFLSGFESELFSGGSAPWFMTVVAILGLRFQTAAQVAR
jgi:O-antigen ligase